MSDSTPQWLEKTFLDALSSTFVVTSPSFVDLATHIRSNQCYPSIPQITWTELIDRGSSLRHTLHRGKEYFLSEVRRVSANLLPVHVGKLNGIAEIRDDNMWRSSDFGNETPEVKFLVIVAFVSSSTERGFSMNPRPEYMQGAGLARQQPPPPPPLSLPSPHPHFSATELSTVRADTPAEYIVTEVRASGVTEADPEQMWMWRLCPDGNIWWKTKIYTVTASEETHCHYNIQGLLEEINAQTKASLVHIVFSDLLDEGFVLSQLEQANPSWGPFRVLYISNVVPFSDPVMTHTALRKLDQLREAVAVIISGSTPTILPVFLASSIPYENILNAVVTPLVAEQLFSHMFYPSAFGNASRNDFPWKKMAEAFRGPAGMTTAFIKMVKNKEYERQDIVSMTSEYLLENSFIEYVRQPEALHSLERLQNIFNLDKICSKTTDTFTFQAVDDRDARELLGIADGINSNFLSLVLPLSPLLFSCMVPFSYCRFLIKWSNMQETWTWPALCWTELLKSHISPFMNYCLQALTEPRSALRSYLHKRMCSSDPQNFRAGVLFNLDIEKLHQFGAGILSNEGPFTFVLPVTILVAGSWEETTCFVLVSDSKEEDLSHQVDKFCQICQTSPKCFYLFISLNAIVVPHLPHNAFIICGPEVCSHVPLVATLPDTDTTTEREEAQAVLEKTLTGKCLPDQSKND
ncbi:hypothetical protein Pelo_17000 [Pelomyxa schiedti]|nr:hypothetical protein Pelo_17000 [Pelomyxa schiedti]